MASIKAEAMKVVENLPDSASWEDLMYQLYVKKKLDEGIQAADAGRVLSHQEVRRTLVGQSPQ